MVNQNWMKDESLKNIAPEKLDFLQKLVFELNELNAKEKLPFLLALANRAQQEHISFTKEEIEAIISVLKLNSSPEELKKMDLMLQKFKAGSK